MFNKKFSQKNKTVKPKIISYILWSLPIIFTVLIFILSKQTYPTQEGVEFGFTFSNLYAEELGLDWRQTYLAILDDLDVRLFRIPAYWNRIEPRSDEFDFSELDWQLDQAQTRDAKVILAVGRRLPRWPECHDPGWLSNSIESGNFETDLLNYIATVIIRYKDKPNIIAWQVENEPFLALFGECPALDQDLLKREINLVRNLDTRPIIITESGELSWWQKGGQLGDIVGVSIYKNTWNDFWGYFNYPLPPVYYYYKTKLVEFRYPGTKVINSELQVEPWTPIAMTSLPLDQQMASIDLNKIQNNVMFAQSTGFKQILLWGAEWWYWLKEVHDMPEIWNYGKTLFK